MKIGVCIHTGKAEFVKSLGYDFIEENLSLVEKADDEKFRTMQRNVERAGIPVYSFNTFFPTKGVSIYAPDAMEYIRGYTARAFERAEALGGKVCVFGSSKARYIEDGIDPAFAEQRLLDALELCGEQADRHGLTVVLEPLNSTETNYINTVTDAADIVRRLGMKNVGALVDFYHFFMENEPDANVESAKDVLMHAHLARPNADRMAPRAEDASTVAHWAELLKKTDYRGAISLECRYGDEFERRLTEATPLMQAFRG